MTIYVLIVLGLVTWFYPFIQAHKGTPPAVVVNRRSRWGILLQVVAFVLLWQSRFQIYSVPPWRIVVSIILFSLASGLSWTSSRALAGQLRIDAALGSEHKLIKSGPYALVRNPIYTSMLLVLCGIGIIITGWKVFAAALLLFIAGTETRVRTEEQLLASRFGEEFETYRRAVPAYLPFLK